MVGGIRPRDRGAAYAVQVKPVFFSPGRTAETRILDMSGSKPSHTSLTKAKSRAVACGNAAARRIWAEVDTIF
jgi:hypothetical protein